MNRYSTADAGFIRHNGEAMVKKPSHVYLLRINEDFAVATNEGRMTAHAGDFLAYDPISGHVWPVAASYVEQHYVPAP